MMKFFSLLLVYFYPIFCDEGKIIEVDYLDILGGYITMLSFNKGKEPSIFYLDLSSNISLTCEKVTSNANMKSDNPIEIPTTFKVKDKQLKAKIVNFKFEFYPSKGTVSDLPFYSLESHYGPTKNTLGLAYKFNDENYSLLHNLKKRNIIDRAAFGFGYLKEPVGKVLLGGFPTKLTEGRSVSHCQVDQGHSAWGCSLRYVLMGEFKYPVKKGYVSFHANASKIFAPQKFIAALKKNIFQDLIKKKICNSTLFMDWNFECDCKSLHLFPDITFVIEDKKYILEKNEVFYHLAFSCFFIIVESPTNEWVIGTSFLKKYLTLFDYENSTISFYSESKLEDYVPSGDDFLFEYDQRKIIFVLVVAVSFVMLFPLVCIVCKIKQSSKNKDKYVELM